MRGQFNNLFAGAGLGLLVGIIAGLSVSPVVSTLLGALAALLAAFLGLSGGQALPDDPELRAAHLHQQRLKATRAGSFGFSCAVAIVFGLLVRNGDIFAPSLEAKVARWTQAGYAPEEAKEFVAFELLGVTPSGKEIKTGDVQKGNTRGLFKGGGPGTVCDEIQPEKFGSVSEKVLNAWRDQSVDKLGKLADELAALQLNEADSRPLINAITEALCALESKK